MSALNLKLAAIRGNRKLARERGQIAAGGRGAGQLRVDAAVGIRKVGSGEGKISLAGCFADDRDRASRRRP